MPALAGSLAVPFKSTRRTNSDVAAHGICLSCLGTRPGVARDGSSRNREFSLVPVWRIDRVRREMGACYGHAPVHPLRRDARRLVGARFYPSPLGALPDGGG